MAKRKYPSELNTGIARLYRGDLVLLTELSRNHGITVAEAAHMVIIGRLKGETKESRVQIPMPGVSFMPAEVTKGVQFTPSRVTGNGQAYVKPRNVTGGSDGRGN